MRGPIAAVYAGEGARSGAAKAKRGGRKRRGQRRRLTAGVQNRATALWSAMAALESTGPFGTVGAALMAAKSKFCGVAYAVTAQRARTRVRRLMAVYERKMKRPNK